MNKKIFQTVFISILMTLVLALAVSIAVFHAEYEERIESDLHAEVRLLSAVAANGIVDIGKGIVPGHRITLISGDGSVLYESERSPEGMENHLERPEVQDALQYGYGEDTRRSDTLLEDFHYAAMRLDDGSILRVAVPADTLLSFVIDMILPMLLILIVLMIFFAWYSFKAAKRITDPINSIDLEHPEDNEDYEELSPLLYRIAKQQATIRDQIESAERTRHEFSIITGNMSEGLAVVDPEARILSINRAFYELFDAQKAGAGDSVLAIDRSDQFSEVLFAALGGKRAETVIERPGRTLQVISSPVNDDGSNTRGAVVIVIDITEKAERESLRREFTANVSHELRTPLTSISGFAELLMNGSVPAEEVSSFAKDIYGEVQRLIALVHDIMRLSRLDEGSEAEIMEKVDLSDIADEVIMRLRAKAQNDDVTLSFSHEGRTELMGSESLLDEMVYNLVENSIKYNKEKGSVSVSVIGAEDKVILTVADTGIGIPDEDKDRVFERFYRVDKSRSRNSGGTGLGLSIVRHAVMFHNGTITLNSKMGEGTTITITFPAIG